MNNYYQHAKLFKKEIKHYIDQPTLKKLHQKKWWRHIMICLQQIVLLCIFFAIAITSENIFVWLPCSIGIGFITFSWNPLLHEVIHRTIFDSKQPLWENILGYFYANMGGLCKTQFTHWHLDHHRELGSMDDPKRAHLTPKIITFWYKALYLTPALFFIYFRASAKETNTYSSSRQKKIAVERFFLLLFHLTMLTLLLNIAGFYNTCKVYLIPYFFIFPIAFTINRIGQHYSIDPDDPAHWTTLMPSHFFWNQLYLYSNLHLEHHYFPKVPCYNLPKLQKLLQPLYKKHNIEPQKYKILLYQWFFLNKVPHSKWN